MGTKKRNPFAPRPAPPPTAERLCSHGRRDYGEMKCEECITDIKRATPRELTITVVSTGVVHIYRAPPIPQKKGRRMGKRPILRPSYETIMPNADSRPRIHLRLVDQGGKVAIGYKAHPTGLERFEPSIELAMGRALSDVSAPAVIIWEGIRRVQNED